MVHTRAQFSFGYDLFNDMLNTDLDLLMTLTWTSHVRQSQGRTKYSKSLKINSQGFGNKATKCQIIKTSHPTFEKLSISLV